MSAIEQTIAAELKLDRRHVAAAIALFADGATIPFVARYRKELTGGMDEQVLEALRDRAAALQALQARCDAMIESLQERELLTDELRAALEGAGTLSELEDLYLPYRPKRKTRAQAARERGLEPLAVAILSAPATDPRAHVAPFIDAERGVPDEESALAGAHDIIAEMLSECAPLRGALRELFARDALLSSKRARGAKEDAEAAVYADYFDWSEAAAKAPSHRVLAMLRGAREGHLTLHALPHEEAALDTAWRVGVATLEQHVGTAALRRRAPAQREFLDAVVADSYKRLIGPSLETELLAELKTRADQTAAAVFATNLRDLLMAAPLGTLPVVAIDPGFRTGCKVVCLDAQGTLLHHAAIDPLPPQNQSAVAAARLKAMVTEYGARVIAVGNGTGGREAEAFAREATAQLEPRPAVIMVNEAGASVYSASAAARDEFPDHDVTVRGAVSIGRRLMDPLAELVKIDPAAIGVGQYQHDVDRELLSNRLRDTVVSCVNAVGVDLNTASPQLLRYVSGLTPAVARSIVLYRQAVGAFRSRAELRNVPGVGPKTEQLAAGFLRVRNGAHPLDASGIHPERYALVERMAGDVGCAVGELIGNQELCSKIDLKRYVSGTTTQAATAARADGEQPHGQRVAGDCSDGVGMPTLTDICAELLRPGRDPRPAFETFAFDETVHSIEDLKSGMELPGRVTNVAAFGAFVDIGVHRDGLIHISKLSDRFVKDPRTVVRVGQAVRVKVLEVDRSRGRINLELLR